MFSVLRLALKNEVYSRGLELFGVACEFSLGCVLPSEQEGLAGASLSWSSTGNRAAVAFLFLFLIALRSAGNSRKFWNRSGL